MITAIVQGNKKIAQTKKKVFNKTRKIYLRKQFKPSKIK